MNQESSNAATQRSSNAAKRQSSKAAKKGKEEGTTEGETAATETQTCASIGTGDIPTEERSKAERRTSNAEYRSQKGGQFCKRTEWATLLARERYPD